MKYCLLGLALALTTTATFAATYVVPPARALVHRADAIVIATPLDSYTTLDRERDDAIETVSTFSVEEAIKGTAIDLLEVREPGGRYGERSTAIGGVPRFRDGERYLLFLLSTKGGWRVLDLALGKFTFATDRSGRNVLMRDEQDI